MSIKCGYCSTFGNPVYHESVAQVHLCSRRNQQGAAQQPTAVAEPVKTQTTTVEAPEPAVVEPEAPAPARTTYRPMADLADQLGLPEEGPGRFALPNPEDTDQPKLFSIQRGRKPGIVFVNRVTSHGGTEIGFLTLAQQKDYLEQIAADPKGAAVLYGKSTGHCSRCGRFLKKKDSIERGMGSTCAQSAGWGEF